MRDEPEERGPGFLGLHFDLAYPSCYKVASQGLRGPTKRKWILQLIKTYRNIKDKECGGKCDPDYDIEELRNLTMLSLVDWSLVLTLTLLLLCVPLILAFLTAFYTPEVGLSCRSLTIAIYGSVQCAQTLLWLWAYAGPRAKVEEGAAFANFFREGGWLDCHGFYTPTSVEHFMGRNHTISFKTLSAGVRHSKFRTVQSLWCVIWYGIGLILVVIAVCAALGGTLMQLIGVYTADICQITTGSWFSPLSQRPVVVVSVNSPQMINNALRMYSRTLVLLTTY